MLPAVAPIRNLANTPESGAAVAICDVEEVENSTEPAAAVTIDKPIRLIFPLAGIWNVLVDAAANEPTMFLFMLARNLLAKMVLDKLFRYRRKPPLIENHSNPPREREVERLRRRDLIKQMSSLKNLHERLQRVGIVIGCEPNLRSHPKQKNRIQTPVLSDWENQLMVVNARAICAQSNYFFEQKKTLPAQCARNLGAMQNGCSGLRVSVRAIATERSPSRWPISFLNRPIPLQLFRG